jgi:hypothetical protein
MLLSCYFEVLDLIVNEDFKLLYLYCVVCLYCSSSFHEKNIQLFILNKRKARKKRSPT